MGDYHRYFDPPLCWLAQFQRERSASGTPMAEDGTDLQCPALVVYSYTHSYPVVTRLKDMSVQFNLKLQQKNTDTYPYMFWRLLGGVHLRNIWHDLSA
jgi:hypothetical protein